MEKLIPKQLSYFNDVVNKKKLQDLMYQTFHNYGVVESALIADKVKNLTFHYATRSGISLNAEDLRVPAKKRQLVGLTNIEVEETEQKYETGTITSVERFQKVIDIWNNASNTLKEEVLTYFRESDPLNPLYIMAFSGARGNISQVRQLVGMRGLMADPQGQIIDLPIKSNFREGLKVTEYVISSYGARKGLVDTALRTADSGYLTRRLVDVAQDIIVREDDCLTNDGLSSEDLFNRYTSEISFKERLIGRVLASPLYDKTGKKLLAPASIPITVALVNDIEKEGFTNLKVRSPLLCNSNRSVCRKCYGWNLAYSKLVDLGEAVGIIAAQSIGEPGTQLTMRTFHTGGVFSGDLTQQIRAPFPGTVSYTVSSKTAFVRTMHGDRGFQLKEDINLYIENLVGTRVYIPIPKGNILLVNDKQKIYASQIIAEIKKDTNLILEEDTRNVYTDVSGETFFQNLDIKNVLDKKGSLNIIAQKSGLIWVLYGERYSLSPLAKLKIDIGEKFLCNNILATHPISNKTAGIVKFEYKSNKKILKILNSSLLFKNTTITQNDKQITLTIINNDLRKNFHLTVKPKDTISHGQTIAVLDDDTYKTKTGGIIFYNIDENTSLKKNLHPKKIFSGHIYWIPEETHVIPSSLLNNLLVKSNTIINGNSELWAGNYAKLSGLVQLDEIGCEVIIKPGELFLIQKHKDQLKRKFSHSQFIKPGELITSGLFAEKLCYVEFIEITGVSYLFIRPVEKFYVPREKGFVLEQRSLPVEKLPNIRMKTIKRLFLKNGEKIKSNTGVNLLQTFLIFHLEEKNSNLQPQIEIVPIRNASANRDKTIKISLYEIFKTSDLTSNQFSANITSFQNYLVYENQYVYANTIVAQMQISAKISGTLIGSNNIETDRTEILLLKKDDIKEVEWLANEEKLRVKVGDLVRSNTLLTDKRKSPYSGQIYRVTKDKILIRLGRPYLISEGTILHVRNKSIVQRSDILATLVYDKLKTVDIVQGLPKVEEILEARKIKNSCLLAPASGQAYIKNSTISIIEPNGNSISVAVETKSQIKFTNGDFIEIGSPLTDGQISPHDMLTTLFNYYQSRLTILEACKVSFKYLQLLLVSEVQRTYLAQGVQIADKHIEVIVKQMTSKVRIEESGNTTLLPGEILSLYHADKLTKTILSLQDVAPFYTPILLGLTKASLNSDSFISAASFQETTRVLTEAAIEGKKDWLIGLKENVIIGRLIPAGTGFNYYDHLQKIKNSNNENTTPENMSRHLIKENLLASRIVEIP